MPEAKVPFQTSMLEVGLGFMSATEQVMPSPFLPIKLIETQLNETDNVDPASSWSQNGVTVDISFISSELALRNKLAAYTGGTLRQGQSDTAFRELLQFTLRPDEAAYVLVTVIVRRAIQQLAEAPLLRAQNQPKRDSLQDFFNHFGDSCITAIEAGGLLVGLIEVLANTDESIDVVRSAAEEVIKAGQRSGAGEVNNTVDSPQMVFEKAVTVMAANRNFNILIGSIGGLVSRTSMAPQEFAQLASEFPLGVYVSDWTKASIGDVIDVKNSGDEARTVNYKPSSTIVPIYAVIRPYNDLPAFLDIPLPFAIYSKSVLRDLERRYGEVRRYKAEVGGLLNNPANVTTLKIDVLEELNQIRGELRERELVLIEAITQFSRGTDAEKDKVIDSLNGVDVSKELLARARKIAAPQA